MSISFIVLFYNDAKTVSRILHDLSALLERMTSDFEIIAVDDGSSDGTGAALDREHGKVPRLRIIHNGHNLGVGASFRAGVKASGKELTAYTDGDYQYDITRVADMINFFPAYDVVSAYRRHRSEGWYRSLVSRHFNYLLNVFYGLNLNDANSGLKIYKTEKLKRIYQRSTHAFFDAEILIKLKQGENCRIVEVETAHRKRTHGSAGGLNRKNVADVLAGFVSADFKEYRRGTFHSFIWTPWIYFLTLVFSSVLTRRQPQKAPLKYEPAQGTFTKNTA